MAIAEKNRAATERAIKALERVSEQLTEKVFPAAFQDLAEIVVDHSRSTKNYQDRTGRTRESHFAEVVGTGETASIEFFGSKGESESESVSSSPNEITLFFGARVFHAPILERLRGFDVAIQTLLFLRREFVKLFGDRVRSRKVF